MGAVIHVGDVPGPAGLCWKQKLEPPHALWRCTKRRGHRGRHTWETSPMANGTYLEIFRGKDGQHYYRVRSKNGRILSVSEGYTRKHDARRGATRAHPALPVK